MRVYQVQTRSKTDSALSEEKTGWGPKLFEGPSTVFDYDLAFCCRRDERQGRGYDRQTDRGAICDWGIDDCKVYNYTSGMEVKGLRTVPGPEALSR